MEENINDIRCDSMRSDTNNSTTFDENIII